MYFERAASPVGIPTTVVEITCARTLSTVLSGSYLECAPVGYDTVAMRGIPEAVALAAAAVLDEDVPDMVAFSLAEEDLDHRLRDGTWYVHSGWEFTDEVTKSALSEDSLPGQDSPYDTLESIREPMSGGWTYNHIEFRRDRNHSAVRSGVVLYALLSLRAGALGLDVRATLALTDYRLFKRRTTDDPGRG